LHRLPSTTHPHTQQSNTMADTDVATRAPELHRPGAARSRSRSRSRSSPAELVPRRHSCADRANNGRMSNAAALTGSIDTMHRNTAPQIDRLPPARSPQASLRSSAASNATSRSPLITHMRPRSSSCCSPAAPASSPPTTSSRLTSMLPRDIWSSCLTSSTASQRRAQ
jgi:hypothetical protein